jgi:hypothetical protein
MPTATVGVNIQKTIREAGLAPGHSVWPRQRVTLRPRGGLPMRITARKSDTRTIRAAARRVPAPHVSPNY